MKVEVKIKALKHFENNKPDYFVGRVYWYENGQYLWSESTGISRLTKQDALLDCKWIVKDRQESNYFNNKIFNRA